MQNRTSKAQFAAIVGIVVNIILAIVKGIAGVIANSRALIADALHSASDIVSSIAVLIGIRAAQKPPDSEHPYGHGKAENIAALIVAIILIIVGFEIMLDSIRAIWENNLDKTGILSLYVIIFSIIAKELLYQYKYRLGIKINSPALVADAWHHRSDAFSSVIALIGIGLAIIGNEMNLSYFQLFDPIAGALIAIIIMWMGFKVAKDAVSVTLETVLSKEETEPYVHTTFGIDGVKRIDGLYARTHGSYVIIDIKISVNPTITVDEGHDIAVKVREKLLDIHDDVQDVHVHVNPYH